MKKLFKRNCKGQSLVEYGLILALVSIVAIAVLSSMGDKIQKTIKGVNDGMEQGLKQAPATGT